MSVGEIQNQVAIGKEEVQGQAIMLKEEGKGEVVARLVREYEGKLTTLKAEHNRELEVGVGVRQKEGWKEKARTNCTIKEDKGKINYRSRYPTRCQFLFLCHACPPCRWSGRLSRSPWRPST